MIQRLSRRSLNKRELEVVKRLPLTRLVQITLNGAGVDLRLRRLLCGKASKP